MKKSIIAAGAASVALAAMPAMGVFADQTDTINVTIDQTCQIDSVSHAASTDTSNVSNSAWTGDSLAGKMTNGTTTDNYGATTFTITCNANGGFSVNTTTVDSLTASEVEDSEGNKLTIAPATDFGASKSGWAYKVTAVSNGITNGASAWQAATATGIVTGSSPISAGTFTVTYGMGISSTQSADTYTGTIVYEIAAAA